uniref:Kinetochore protein NUF2 n=1 Tax=Rhodosorus marinus TaxID=101924 RepID=A0A7S3A1N2_9RHOD|mmetsp:Transcript_41408/g.163091  ORF Transcript_41408/g.163091 Transcript_41408/m.163091 type:complete len:454 (+) Transcript_41408:377-1738(+)|eukprot:CAMPEP_0113968734 /NCGR_PEP_ID=MMETSP0011_2-20120614/9738_1 /TAXON_ID=101924 /ORGANISM="Rhodosorus marinus" /LENGTH=453 /DNA_ID=CAMNT_0000981937 /DNA_START=275 /DNA_END=1636 /DNA_ORIENTATION=- /assembly_acc=CAM_ASM_000156
MMSNRYVSTPSKSAPQYSFPILSPDEIFQCLGELQIPFSEDYLRKPSADSVRALFEQFLELLMGSSKEELSQPVFGAVDVISYPELHEDSIPFLAFHRRMQKLMTACGVPDFCMNDYAKPDYQRLRRLLSAVINLAKFREERLIRFQDLNNRSEALLERKQALAKTNASLKAEIDLYNKKVEAERPQSEALEKKTSSLASELQELHEKQSKLQADIRKLKAEASELAEKAASLKVKVLHEEQEVGRYESMVVSSPERVRKEIEDQQEQLEYDREQIVSMERRTRELQNRVSGLQVCETDVRMGTTVMEECEREMDRSKVQLQLVRDRKQAISIAESELRRLENQESYLKRQVQSSEERISRIQKQISDRELEVQASYEKLQNDRVVAERERTAVESRIAQNEKLVSQTSDKKAKLGSEFEAEIESSTEAYRKLEDQVVKYHRQLFTHMQEARV